MFFRFSFDNVAAAMRQSVFVPLLFFVASPLLAQELKEFSNGEIADADDVNFNFTLLKDAIWRVRFTANMTSRQDGLTLSRIMRIL